MISGEWCGFCKYAQPNAERICADNDITFIKLDVDDLPKQIKQPDAVPTFLFRVDSKTLETWPGSNLDKLKEKCTKHFGRLK